MATYVEPGHEQMTEDEEKIRIEDERKRAAAEEAATAEAREALAKPARGVAPTKAELQVTGGSKEIKPEDYPDRDEHLEVVVRGWVKQDKTVTVKQGESAMRVAVFVTDEIVSMRWIEPPQLTLDQELADDPGPEAGPPLDWEEGEFAHDDDEGGPGQDGEPWEYPAPEGSNGDGPAQRYPEGLADETWTRSELEARADELGIRTTKVTKHGLVEAIREQEGGEVPAGAPS